MYCITEAIKNKETFNFLLLKDKKNNRKINEIETFLRTMLLNLVNLEKLLQVAVGNVIFFYCQGNSSNIGGNA